MRRLSVAFGWSCSLLLLCVPAPVSAQTRLAPQIAGGGYSFVRDYLTDNNYPLGWFASGACNITNWLTGVGEISGTYKTYDVSLDSLTFSSNVRQHSYLGGVRHARRVTGIVPFAQFLVGVTRESGGATIFRQSIAEPQTKLTFQPGGGVDVPLTNRLSARVAADYRLIRAKRANTDQKNDNQLRVAVGVVVGFGR